MVHPQTNPSLLLRIRDSGDREAWDEFSSIYRPAIIALAKYKGLQNADAEDLAQQVLLSVAKAIPKWQHDSTRASFRTWLNRVTHNAVINAVTRRAPDRAVGMVGAEENSRIVGPLDDHPVEGPDSAILTTEIRRQVFRYAANEIQTEFQPATWQAFWLTAVEGQTVDDVAARLEKQTGSIYAARSRVMRRLKQKVQELQLLDWEEQND